MRASLEDGAGAWELQLLHHKLYLEDPPPGIDHLEVTHGFNILTVGRAFRLGSGLSARVAAGVAVTHTESIVRGVYEGGGGSLSGYEVAGPAALAGAAGRSRSAGTCTSAPSWRSPRPAPA